MSEERAEAIRNLWKEVACGIDRFHSVTTIVAYLPDVINIGTAAILDPDDCLIVFKVTVWRPWWAKSTYYYKVTADKLEVDRGEFTHGPLLTHAPVGDEPSC